MLNYQRVLWKPLAMDWKMGTEWEYDHGTIMDYYENNHGLLWKRPWDQWELRWTEWTGEEYGNIIFSQLELDVKCWISGCKLQLKIEAMDISDISQSKILCFVG